MIDINSSLLLQLINFVFLFIVLHFILFKPIRGVMQEREQGIGSALSDAKIAQERMRGLLEQYNTLLAEAKQKATNAYGIRYQQGLDAQRDMISAERAKAGEMLDKARAEVSAASAAARGELKKEAERLSQDITAKLLGRSV